MPPVLRLKEFVLGAPAEETVPFESTAAPAMFEKPPQETSVTQWNYEFQEALKIRKEEENVAKAGHIKQARKDLEQSQAQCGKKKEACMAKHQNDKQPKLEDVEAD